MLKNKNSLKRESFRCCEWTSKDEETLRPGTAKDNWRVNTKIKVEILNITGHKQKLQLNV